VFYIDFSTLLSHVSTAPSAVTLLSRATYSPSGAFRPYTEFTYIDLPALSPPSILLPCCFISKFFIPSNSFLICG